MKQNDFDQQLRNRMADYEAPLPDDLWDGIVHQLDAPKRQVRLVTFLRKAAAVALLLIGVGAGYWMYHRQESAIPIQEQQQAVSRKMPVTVPEMVSEQEAHLRTVHRPQRVSPLPVRKMLAEGVAAVEQPSVEQPSVEQHMGERPSDEQHTGGQPSVVQPSLSETIPHSQQAHQPQTVTSIRRPHLSVSLLAVNVMGSRKGAEPFVMSSAYMGRGLADTYSAATGIRSAPRMYLANYSEETQHHQPVGFGLSVRYGLTPRLGIQSGLVYTTVSSDFIHHLDRRSIQDHQRLHYVGLPLRIDYELLRLRQLSFYGVAGGEADVCVGAQLTSNGIRQQTKKDRMQFSADAALGVQYDVLPQLGVYVEPGVKYYFNNGSQVENIFKEKPWNFSLQLGLRLSFHR